MINLLNYIQQGLKNTLLMKNTTGFSHNGPWIQVFENTVLDRFYVGDFSSVEYTISVDLDNDNKEILKVLVTATLDNASIVIYARNNTERNLVTVDATVNNSYVDVMISPVPPGDSTIIGNPKAIFTAQYFHNQNPHYV